MFPRNPTRRLQQLIDRVRPLQPLPVPRARPVADACDALARPGAPLPTGTPAGAGCADEIDAVYGTAATRTGAAAFAGRDRRTMEPGHARLPQLMQGWSAREIRGSAASARAENLAAPVGATQQVGTPERGPTESRLRRLDQLGLPAAGRRGLGRGRRHRRGPRHRHPQHHGPRRGVHHPPPVQPAARRQVSAAGDSDTDISFLRCATALRLVPNRNKNELMCRAYDSSGGTTGPVRRGDTSVVPDQADTVFPRTVTGRCGPRPGRWGRSA
ncbi:hypothetical protein ACFYNW_27710 [Streptomyces virginiae]|uniref:hypothetical protein n=1 Tax=Streptomyces virginiae TaxID=1961 RepID=UPI0033B604C6